MKTLSLSQSPDEASQDGPVRPMRILVIDDNELDRERLTRLCGQAGMRFEDTQVEGLAELTPALDKHSYDIIFIDYFLAGDTGLDALEIILEHDKQKGSASIMLAGEGQISIAVEAMRMGCSDYMTKAMMNIDTLQKSVATALERRLMTTEMEQARESRVEAEESIRAYARACTVEMREILSGTLRRVRKLRTYKEMNNIDYVVDLHSLETEIDRLWDALPEFKSERQIAKTQTPLPLTSNARH